MDTPWISPPADAFLRRLPPGVGRGLVVALGLMVALASGFAATGESLHALVFVVAALTCGLLLLAIMHPRVFLALMLPNLILIPVVPFVGGRVVNPLDVLLPIALLTTWLFSARERIREVDSELAARHRDLVRAGLAYFAVALLSLFQLAAHAGVAEAFDSFTALARSMQAASFFYLVGRSVRGPGGVRLVRDGLLAGIGIAALINLPAVLFFSLPRAGAILTLGEAATNTPVPLSLLGLPIVLTKPNELGAACVLAWALLLALPPRRALQVAAFVVSFVLLLATQSRSGLVSLVTLLVVYGVSTGRRRLLLLPLLGAPILAILPPELQGRLLRTMAMEQGSFEVFSSFIRLYGWQVALDVFRAHPLFGVGYLGFQHVSHDYNVLGLYLGTVENFFLETAVGMGVLGLAALGLIAAASWRLGRAAMRHSEPGSMAHRMGQVTPAFLLAVAVGNLTGDNLIGFLNGAQLVIFLALLSRTMLLPECRRRP